MHSILKIVFLEIQNKAIRPVLSGPVTYVTKFAETDLMSTNTLPVDVSHTHALSRDTKHLIIDGQVCFFRWLYPMMLNHKGAFHGLCGP